MERPPEKSFSKDELERLSVDQIKEEARKRGIPTNKYKSKLIGDILKYDSGQKVKTRKAISKAPPVKQIEPSGDVLSTLPLELRGENALLLEYPDILKLCKMSKGLSKICSDPNFWRRKINTEYPMIDISRLNSSEYRARYEKLYVDWLKEKILILEEDLENEKYELEQKYEKKEKTILDNIELLEKNIKKNLPEYLNVSYNEIRLSEDDISELSEHLDMYPNMTLQMLIGTLSDFGAEPEYALRPGDLVGIVEEDKDYYSIPQYLIYIYTIGYEDKPDVIVTDYVMHEQEQELNEYPETLITEIKENGYSVSDIPSIYNLQFDTAGFNEHYKELENE